MTDEPKKQHFKCSHCSQHFPELRDLIAHFKRSQECGIETMERIEKANLSPLQFAFAH